jgi:cobalt-zinc-cadmium resistance protein CzcA
VISIVRFALRSRMLIMGMLALMLAAGHCLLQPQHRGLSRSRAADGGDHHAIFGHVGRGDGAQRHHPHRGAAGGPAAHDAIRTISLFGLSDVKVQFTYDFTFEQAQQQVINRLSQLPALPGGIVRFSPTSPIGEIFRYRIRAPKGYSVMDLKTLQDWVLQRRFKAIPGVIDVTGWGGKLRAYEVEIDSAKLAAHQTSVSAVLQALAKSNGNTGGQTINFGPQSAIVRSVGLIQSPSQIESVLVATNAGVPVMLRDVAR